MFATFAERKATIAERRRGRPEARPRARRGPLDLVVLHKLPRILGARAKELPAEGYVVQCLHTTG